MANIGMQKVYQEFDPVTRWTSEPDAEILVVDLPGSFSFFFFFSILFGREASKLLKALCYVVRIQERTT